MFLNEKTPSNNNTDMKEKRILPILKPFFLLFIAPLVYACGGGIGNVENSHPTQQAPDIAPQIELSRNQSDQLQINWEPQDNIRNYILFLSKSTNFASNDTQTIVLDKPPYIINAEETPQEYFVRLTSNWAGNSSPVSNQLSFISPSLKPENNAPIITSAAEIRVNEGSTSATTIEVTNQDSANLTFRILGGDDANLFSMGEFSGDLQFLEPPNFENPIDADENNIYQLTIEVGNQSDIAQQALKVTVLKKNPNDLPQLSFLNSGINLVENQELVLIEIRLDKMSNQQITVDYTTIDDTALATEDYEFITGTLLFEPGDISKTISIKIIDDTKIEQNETFKIKLSNVSFASIEQEIASITINDNDNDNDNDTNQINAPKNLSASVQNNAIFLQWEAVANVDSYRIYRSEQTGGSTTENNFLVENLSAPNFTDSDIILGRTYYYIVDALKDQNHKSSDELTVRTYSKKFNIRSESYGYTIELQWEPILNTTHYQVLISTQEFTIFNSSKRIFDTVNTFLTVGPLQPNTQYYFQIIAITNEAEQSSEAFPLNTKNTTTRWTTGGFHNCEIRADQSLWCWGSNSVGQLGNGATEPNQRSPIRIGLDLDWRQIALGAGHTCGIKTNSSLWCWGSNKNRQLGTNVESAIETKPVKIGTDTDWALLSLGVAHSCAIKTDASLWCWGSNENGKIGLDIRTTVQTTPGQIGSDKNWKQVSLGLKHTCALKTDNTLWCWGNNIDGQLGDDSDNLQRSAPSKIGSDTDWDQLQLGANHSCALKSNGSLWCWGSNTFGQLGNGSPGKNQNAPRQVGTDTNWRRLSLSISHTCGIKINGSLWCWGINGDDGQLGDGSGSFIQTTPIQIGTNVDWLQVNLGSIHGCAQKTNRSLHCWGSNTSGQLGDGSISIRKTKPVVVVGTNIQIRDLIELKGTILYTSMTGVQQDYGFKGLDPALFYAVSVTDLASDIDLEVFNDRDLQNSVCVSENFNTEPENCIARSNRNGEIFIRLTDFGNTQPTFKLNINLENAPTLESKLTGTWINSCEVFEKNLSSLNIEIHTSAKITSNIEYFTNNNCNGTPFASSKIVASKKILAPILIRDPELQAFPIDFTITSANFQSTDGAFSDFLIAKFAVDKIFYNLIYLDEITDKFYYGNTSSDTESARPMTINFSVEYNRLNENTLIIENQ